MADEAMTAQEFQALVKGKSDEEILEGAKGNEEPILDGIFEAMKEAFDPSTAAGQTAVIQYDVDTPVGVKSYQIKVDNGTCAIEKGAADNPRVTLVLNLPNFIRVMTGELDGQQAFMSGKLKIGGDMMFSMNLNRWFKQVDG
jgi:putative sterol carrier protein